MTATTPAVAPPAPRRALTAPTPAQVVLLQSVRAYPAVSLLLDTGAGAALSPAGAARLDRLLEQASRCLAAEDRPDLTAPVLRRLAAGSGEQLPGAPEPRPPAGRRAGRPRGQGHGWLRARDVPRCSRSSRGFHPARISDDGTVLVPASDVEAPDVVDDAVDELIELVLERGGWVALVDDGALAQHGGVAVTLRS